jgi:hypothetical protein
MFSIFSRNSKTEAEMATLRAIAGATHLDEHFGGPDWAARVNIGTLDISNDRCCMVAQLKGRYNNRAAWLGIVDPEGLGVEKSDDVGYDALTAAWKPEIERRQRALAHQSA